MENNPFNSDTFTTIWLKHFRPKTKTYTFKSIQNIKFYKSRYFNLFYDVGKNITNGIYYSINDKNQDYKGKTFLIYDVPDYFKISYSGTKNQFKIKKIKQYDGATAFLNNFESFDAYFHTIFKSNSRYKHKRNTKRFESCFDASYKIFWGAIEKEEYDLIFNKLIENIKRRFYEKGMDNRILGQKGYYYDLIYPMILEKRAVLGVIYSNNNPVAVSVGFLSNNIMYYSITSFDIDYYRFNLGHITIIKLLNWCFDNNFNRFDFSKGLVDYKKRWTNHQYYYEYHILYDSKSISSILLSNFLFAFFAFKQFLRDYKVNYLYSKWKFILKRNRKKSKSKAYNISVEELTSDNSINVNQMVKIDIENNNFRFLKSPLFDYLYKHPENIKVIKLYKESDSVYYALGEKTKLKLFYSK